MEESGRVDHEPKCTETGGVRCGAFETDFVQQVDRWIGPPTECDEMLELPGGPDGFDQCPSDPAASAETTATPPRGANGRSATSTAPSCGSYSPVTGALLRREPA